MRVRLSERGGIVIPKTIRERLHLAPGVELELVAERGSLILRPVREPERHARLEEVAGCLARGRRRQPVPVEEMDEAVGEAFRRAWSRG